MESLGGQGGLEPLLLLVPHAALYHVALIQPLQRREAEAGAGLTLIPRCCIPVAVELRAAQDAGKVRPEQLFSAHSAGTHAREI